MQPDTKLYLDQISFSDDDMNLEEGSQLGNFSFLEVDMNIIPFKYKLHPSDKPSKILSFVTSKQEFKLLIYLCIEDDTLSSSKKLRKTLDTIYLSLPELEKIGITNQNIILFMYFLRFSSDKTFNQIYPQMDYLSSCCTGDPNFNCSFLYCLSATGIPISVLAFNKNNSTRVETLKCFYLNVINDIFFINQQEQVKLNLIVWENGILPTTTALTHLIQSASDKAMAAIPLIDSIPNNLFGEIQQFDIVLQQIFNLHYYDMTTSSPLDHRFYYLKIDENIYNVIKDYFNHFIHSDAGVNYHDYKFGIFLDLYGYETFYIQEISVYYVENNITFNDLMRNSTVKKAGYFLVFFTLLTSLFTQCSDITFFHIIKKIFLFFQILEILFEFIRPSITILIVYCVFQEAFSYQDERLTTFFIVLYSIFLICTICFSLISPNQTGNDKTVILLNVLFSLFYFLILACGIVAIHFIRVNNINDKYKFNLTAMLTLIILNVIFILVPVFFHCEKIKSNLKRMIQYIFIAYPSYLTVFSFHALMNFTDQYGNNAKVGQNNKIVILNERKKIFVLLFILTNAFIGFLCFFLTNRTLRVDTIFVLGTLVTVFNGMEMFAIVTGIIRLHIRKKKMHENVESVRLRLPVIQHGVKNNDVRSTLKTEMESLNKTLPTKKKDDYDSNKELFSKELKQKSISNGNLSKKDTKEKKGNQTDEINNKEDMKKEDINKQDKTKKNEANKEGEGNKFKRRSKKAKTTRIIRND